MKKQLFVVSIALAIFTVSLLGAETMAGPSQLQPTTNPTVATAVALTLTAYWTTPTATTTPIPTATFTSTPMDTPLPQFTPTFTIDQEIQATVIAALSGDYSGGNESWRALHPQGLVKLFDGVPMDLVPAGCFTIGANPQQENELNGNRVCFDQSFWIDQTEVTQRTFNRLEGKKSQPNRFDGAHRPVENITWFEAHAFCMKRGAHLPTEAEWEYAARGPDEWEYPWGNEWNPDNLIWNHLTEAQGTNDVGTIAAGASWVGALDMSGNVIEWTNSRYRAYPYDSNDGREETGLGFARVLRGGNWDLMDPILLRGAARDSQSPHEAFYAGFRCARSIG